MAAAQEVLFDIQELRVRVDEIMAGNPGVVAVDGWPGAGKSTMCQFLARELDWVHIEVDHFVRGSYLDHIDYEGLSRAIHQNTNQIILVDGACVRVILARINVDVQLHLYVKRADLHGGWRDKHLLLFETLEEAIEHSSMSGRVQPDELRREVLRYHYNYCPHRCAQLVYERRSW